MKICDAHCDVLYKLWKLPTETFLKSDKLQIDYESLIESNVKVVCFALFVPPSEKNQWAVLQKQLEIFHKQIITMKHIIYIKDRKDIQALKENEIGAALTLEGLHPIEGKVERLESLLQHGLLSVGLTWNNGNTFFSGIGDTFDRGIKKDGYKLITLLNEYNCWIDVSHASRKTTKKVIPLARFPIATHSNIYDICNHKRNLKREEIELLIKNNGKIGLTFVPSFIQTSNWREAFVKQIDYIISLGGENNIVFGSDFDGMDTSYQDLANINHWENVIELLCKNYTSMQVKKFLFTNLSDYFCSLQ